jgi:hypothetical protein
MRRDEKAAKGVMIDERRLLTKSKANSASKALSTEQKRC